MQTFQIHLLIREAQINDGKHRQSTIFLTWYAIVTTRYPFAKKLQILLAKFSDRADIQGIGTRFCRLKKVFIIQSGGQYQNNLNN